jgi:hypothetical protein
MNLLAAKEHKEHIRNSEFSGHRWAQIRTEAFFDPPSLRLWRAGRMNRMDRISECVGALRVRMIPLHPRSYTFYLCRFWKCERDLFLGRNARFYWGFEDFLLGQV